MIISTIIFILSLKGFVIPYLLNFELLLLLFFNYYCLTALFANYGYYSLRLIILIVIVFFFYFVLRFLLYKLSIESIEKIINKTGLIFNLISLLLFVMGAYKIGFNFVGNNITYLGLLIDRGMPRLIGTSIDPNIFVLFNTLFFFYFLEKKHKVGTVLSFINILLTFSRGGLIAIGASILISIIMSKNKRKLRLIIGIAITSVIIPIILNTLFNISIWNIINERFLSMDKDGGSGRFEIWGNALEIFRDNPIFGIGIYNFQQYNLLYFNDYHYPHNTYLEILVESGIVGLTLYLVFFITLICKLFKLQKAKQETRFLFLTAMTIIITITALSSAASEFLFLFFALSFRYIIEYEKRWEGNV